MRLLDSIYEYLKKEVAMLLDTYSVTSYPIDIDLMAYKMGIQLVPYDSLGKKRNYRVFANQKILFQFGLGISLLYFLIPKKLRQGEDIA